MTRDEIERRLIDIIRQEKDLPEGGLQRGASLADAGIDSLDSLSILFAIEDQFHLSIPDELARSLRTLEDMVSAVESLQSD